MQDRARQQARETAPGRAIPHESAALHVAGEATYVDVPFIKRLFV